MKILLTGVALYFVITHVDIGKVLSHIKKTGTIGLISALFLFALSKLIAAFRLHEFFRCAGIDISYKENLKLYLLGMYYNLFLPGGIGGDGYKIYFLKKKYEAKLGKIVWATVLDRASGLSALSILAAIFAMYIEQDFPFKEWVWALIPIGLLTGFLIYRFLFTYFTPVYFKSVLYALGVQTTQVIAIYLLLQAMGVTDKYAEYLFAFLVSSIVSVIPVFFGGFGSRELTFILFYSYLGIDKDLSISLSIIFNVISVLVSSFGIYYSLNEKAIKKRNASN